MCETCGVFATICADYISDDLPLKFNQKQMLGYREKIGTDIVRGHLLYPEFTLRMDDESNNNTKRAFLFP